MRAVLQCALGFAGLAAFVVAYTWLVPGWWATM